MNFERDDLISLRESYQQRMDLMKARQKLEAQIMCYVRRITGRETVPIKEALSHEYIEATLGIRKPYEDVARAEKAAEKQLIKLAKKLPEYHLKADMRGFGELTFASVLGECGDLCAYATHGKLWKRMGVGLVDGERQRKVAGNPELAIKHGYSPRRRAIMYNFSESAIKQGGKYAELYRERKSYEIRTAKEQGLTVFGTSIDPVFAKMIVSPAKAKGLPKDKTRALIHCDKRAKRYIAKQALRDLWKAWRRFHATPIERVLRDEGASVPTADVEIRRAAG